MIRQGIGAVTVRDVRTGKNVIPIKVSGQYYGICIAEILRLRQVTRARLQIRAQRWIDGLGGDVKTPQSQKHQKQGCRARMDDVEKPGCHALKLSL
jgi:hypothetical protein